MADIKTVLAGVCKGLAELINSCGLEPVDKSGEIKDDNGKCAVEYKGEGKALRFEYFNKKISVSAAVKEDGEIIDSDYHGHFRHKDRKAHQEQAPHPRLKGGGEERLGIL